LSEQKELSTETRSLIAAVLCLIVIVGWSFIYKPPETPAPTQPNPALINQGTNTGAGGGANSSSSSSTATNSATASAPATPVPPAAVRAATEERSYVIESDLYRVQISNRGGVVHSWQLKKFTDDHEPPRILDLVHGDTAAQSGGFPFSMVLDDLHQESQVSNALFEVTASGSAISGDPVIQAPAEITLAWSDGHLEVTKKLRFDNSYIVEVESSALLDGKPLPHSLSWRGGFGDATAFRAAAQTQVFTSVGGKLNTITQKNLGRSGQTNIRAVQSGTYDFAGIEDLYFAAVYLPPLNTHGDLVPAPITLTGWTYQHDTLNADGKTETETVSEIAGGVAAPGPLNLRVYVGPKSVDGLKAVHPPLNSLIQFGYLGFISEPLFYFLLWLHRYLTNYGWDIVLITVLINMVMFPLKVKSMRGMMKMQSVAPEVKAIQDRYKKYSMRDPRKAEMNKEVMEVYSREGINPLGSCWPTLIQFPIWYCFYRMLANAIELRHAGWLLWIRDLSAHDPYYILPIIMAVSMYLMQKMTPAPGMDPAQAKMMGLMPLVFGGMFALSPSGLALYILTSNLIGILQQWYLLRTNPPLPKKSRGPSQKK
jgi:YidC/Oxa1 family membrane protein insertase